MLPPPSISDLYLAFRQAKIAHFFEKRGVGLLEFAAYEAKLPENLIGLRSKLATGAWFDNLQLGETWVVPKRLRPKPDSGDGVVRIGSSRPTDEICPIDIQLRLSPHPEFATAEVLYLWRFGGILEALLSCDAVLGYRLDLREQRVVPHRRWLFEYWPSRYQKFRMDPLNAAKDALERGKHALIISGDLANFYDTVSPQFMLGDVFVAELLGAGAPPGVIDEYRQATLSLIRAYGRFHNVASRRAASPIQVGVPIGALTSRVVANLALATLDEYVTSRQGVLCYRRYVDDLAIVAEGDGSLDLMQVIGRFLPLVSGGEDILQLDMDALGRPGCELQLQKTKVRVHNLTGEPGADFVDAVASDFAKAVSERRAFIDSSTLVADGVAHLIRAGEAEGSPLRVLRDADRARLERFALSTSLNSLERVSSLIGRDEARELVRGTLERIGRVLHAEDNWVNDFDVTLRLLKLAIGASDWKSAAELQERMDRVWGTIEKLHSTTVHLFYRDRAISPEKRSPWTWLRNYLHERRIEAICSTLPLGADAAQLRSRIPDGVMYRTRVLKATALRRRAERLASADLRARDREDDAIVADSGEVDHGWLLGELSSNSNLSKRLESIEAFVRRCGVVGGRQWSMPAARLFLCTRPPSYFDIAHRWLSSVEEDGFAEDIFEKLLAIVNAVRGTEYRQAVGRVVDPNTVSIASFWAGEPSPGSSSLPDPRIILGNLVVEDDDWKAAATRISQAPHSVPRLTLNRIKGVARVLEKATRVARGHASAVLVLPELSLPRRWFRTVANYVVRLGRFSLVTGLEYWHDPALPHVKNQVFAVLPGPFSSAATWPWTKRLPAREEAAALKSLQPSLSFPAASTGARRTVVTSSWGALSVLICSELIEARRIADLLGRVDVVLCPAWNPDTSSYDHLIQSAGFQLHSIIAIANNGHYSDCRAWAPLEVRWERDLCRLIERNVNDIVHVDIPLASLVAFRKGTPGGWRPLPPEWP